MSLVGQTIGTFEIEAEIGHNRWGTVYRARQRTIDRTVALKAVSPEMAGVPGQTEHFLQVMRATAQIVHAHIVTVYEAGYADGVHYCAMEYMDGPPLAEFLRRDDAVDEQRLLQTIWSVARVLAFLWQRNIAHESPAPRNILNDSTGMVKLINVLPLDNAPAQSPQEDILALGLILANFANEISPVSKRVSEIVERMVGAAGRDPFTSPAELALAAADLEHELFPPIVPVPAPVVVETIEPKKAKPVLLVAGILAVVLLVAGLLAWRMLCAKPPVISEPVAAPAAP
jgi:serine/threonine protein kinase